MVCVNMVLTLEGLLLGIEVPLLVYVEGVLFSVTICAEPILINLLVLITILINSCLMYSFVRLFISYWIIGRLYVS
jgi:hypothetical protein